MKKVAAIIVAVALGIFCFSVSSLPMIGDVNSAPNQHVTPYYIENSAADTGSPNIVTATLADYRGFDTLEETTVMFLAGMTAVLILLAGRKDEDDKKEKEEKEAEKQ